MGLTLEINKNSIDKTNYYSSGDNCIMVCPPTDENYWVFRVNLYKDQSVLGFLKYGLIGVGMAWEENSNTNLPTNSGVNRISNHIKCNKKYKNITLSMIKKAVQLIIDGAKQYKT